MTVQETKSGISRRDLIKKGAVAGAIVWTIPMIETVPAYAATGSGCPPSAPLAISGAAVVYTIGGGSTVYWAAFGSGQTTCSNPPSVPNDSDFAAPVAACGAYVQVSNGSVLYGTSAGTVAVPQVLKDQNGNLVCYFTASATGVNVTAAGIAAGVQIQVALLHNGTFPAACQTFGSKGHWVLECGQSGVNCSNTAGCIGS